VTRTEDWPADLDLRAALDLRGELRPAPVRPPVAPKAEPLTQPASAQAQEAAILRSEVGRLTAIVKDRERRNGVLRGRLRRRDRTIASLRRQMQALRGRVTAAQKREREARAEVRKAARWVADRYSLIEVLRSDAAESGERAVVWERKFDDILERAHDWLELREGKKFMRELKRK
jgi:hypothetical protein